MPSETTEARRGLIVEANGTGIFYKEHGRGRPLVLFHGGSLSGALRRDEHSRRR